MRQKPTKESLRLSYSSHNEALFDSVRLRDRVWWICDKDHQWEASMNNRIHASSGCPYCANKRVLAGYNDLVTTHPKLAGQWSANNDSKPSEALAGSSVKALWQCSEGHEWVAGINERSRRDGGRGCPYCANRKVLAGYNDLATTLPDMAVQLSPNNVITAQEISAGSDKKLLWVCPVGHEWEASVQKRVSGRGCAVCDGKQVQPGVNDLATTNPRLLAMWSVNNIVSPQEITQRSRVKMLWVCSKGHEWESTPHSVANSGALRGCPYCSGKKVLIGFNDLLSQFPVIAEELDCKNSFTADQVVFGSKKRALWRCNEGHEWEAVIENRTRLGSGCPRCARSVSQMETEVSDLVKSLLPEMEVFTSVRNVISPKELDIFIPELNIAIEFNGLYWHTESRGKDQNYHRNKFLECQENGIQLIQVWEDDWRNRRDTIVKMLTHKLGVSVEERIFARQTIVSIISLHEATSFLEQNHIQGSVSGSYYLGLRKKTSNEQTFEDDELVSVMILKKQGEDLLLSRYATSKHVIGGQSKLVKHAEKNLDYVNLITFADLEVSAGALYEKTGFIRDDELLPDYSYLYDGIRQHKFGFRVNRFRDDENLEYEEGLSERELALLNGVERIWDSGKIRYVKPRPERNK